MKVSKKGINGLFFAAILSLLVFVIISIVSTDMKGETPDTRSPANYQGYSSCSGCHDNIITDWLGTNHSQAWVVLNDSGEQEDWCEVCHSTGAEDLAHGGFDPVTDQPEYLKNVSCEACHGPGEDHVASPVSNPLQVNYSAEVCSTCHKTAQFDGQQRTYHPYYDEWLNSKHALSLAAAGGVVSTDPNCQGCHVAQVAVAETIEGGTADRPITNPQPITCAVCHDPHGSPFDNQLRKDPADLCSSCHDSGQTMPGEEIRHPQSYMRSGISDIDPFLVPKKEFMKDVLCSECHLYSTGPPQNVTGHSFRFKPEACSDCHMGNPATIPLTVDQASSAVSKYQSDTSELLLPLLQNLATAETMIEEASSHGFSLSTIDIARDLYDDANYSANFVIADKSFGAHNPRYAVDLLKFASNRTETVISMLTPGHVTGRVVDSENSPVVGVIVRRAGMDLAISGSNGTFSFDYASGTYDFNLVKDGYHVGTLSGVSIEGGATTEIPDTKVTLATPFDLTWPLVAIIVLLVIVVILLVGRLTRTKEGKEEQSEEPKAKEGESSGS